jgi:uncharacterized membrane protein
VPLLIVPVLVVLAVVAFIPLALVQRYRMGVARQRARGWLATINVMGFGVSGLMFVLTAAMTTIWIHGAFVYTIGGLTTGSVLGVAGIWLTRWESTPTGLYFTPNRWLVLSMTLVVTGRLLYGFWRAWHAWDPGLDHASWAAAAGLAKSMAAGGVVLGYYFVYWIGVRARFRLQRASRNIPSTTRRRWPSRF